MNYSVVGNALHLPYPDGVAQVCVTSPPYFGARRYLPSGHSSQAAEIGLESSPSAYVAQIVAAMGEVWRVLRPDAVLFLNLGDSFGPNKQLLGIPWRVAFALQDDGWILRQGITWCKTAPIPESVQDRPTSATEMVFLMAKQSAYFYDAEAIAEPAQPFRASGANNGLDHPKTPKTHKKQDALGKNTYTGFNDRWRESGGVATRNARNFWVLGPAPFPGAHSATMQPEIARRCILAGSRPGDIVLDPFAGSGTTAMVALQNGRRAIGTELNPAYLRLQDDRTQVTLGLGL